MATNYIVIDALNSVLNNGGVNSVTVTSPLSPTIPASGTTITSNGDGTASWAAGGGGGGPPTGAAGGDLGSTYPNPTVISVAHITTGVLPAVNQAAQTMAGAVTGTTAASLISLTGNTSITGALPTANQVAQSLTLTGDVTSSGGTTAAATTVITALAVSKLAAGTANQVLLNNATPTPVWTTLTGDVSNSVGVTSVLSLTGSSSAIPIATTGAVLTWAAATVTPGLKQTTAASDVATTNTVITPQAPFASAVTNPVGGSLVVALPTSVNASSTRPYLTVTYAGDTNWQLGTLFGSGGATAAIYTNLTPSATNFSLSASTTTTSVNAPSGGTIQLQIAATNTLIVTSTALQLASTVSTPVIQQNTQTSDVAVNVLTVRSQATFATATTNVVGGALNLASGIGSNSAAINNAGKLNLQAGATTIQGVDGYGAFVALTSAVSVATTGTVTLTVAQAISPYIILSGTLTGNVTVALPASTTVSSGTARVWYFDINAVVFATHTLTFSIGSGATTASVTTLTTNSNILTLFAPSNNVCYLNL